MNKRFQKGLAVSALAAMVVAPFAQPVFAVTAGDNGLTPVPNDDKTLVLKKELVVRDLDDASYTPEVPDVTFTYTMSNGTDGTFTSKQKDKTDQIFQVKGGTNADAIKVNGTAKSGIVEFSESDDASSGKATENISLDFSALTFDAAGIYRYVITESDYTTQDGNDYSKALPQTTEDKTRNIDVYVEDDGTGTFVVKGYVVSKTDTSEGKESGFTEEKTADGQDVDSKKSSVYSTYDITLEKKVSGAKDNNAGYTFVLTLPTDTNGTYKFQKNTDAATTVETTDTYTYTVPLKKNDKIKLQGLPVGHVVTVTENKIDGFATPDITVDGTAKSMTESGTTWVNSTDVKDNGTKNDATDVVVTNKSDSILPPTGILMTIAPFAAMVGLGAALIALFAKKRKNEA